MIVIACPGQGSQTPGFLKPWLEDPENDAFVRHMSDETGVDLITHGTVSDADTIRDTSIAQPLIVTASLLAWRALSQQVNLDDAGVAGHSVGEFAAAAISGVMSEPDALSLVAARGQAMARAAAAHDTSMSAVLGGVEDLVLETIAHLGLVAANRNGGGQIVAAGESGALAELADNAPRGVRVVPLSVAGAFHTSYMESATADLQQAAQGITVQDPQRPLWTNSDGSMIKNGEEFRSLLIQQVSQPVRWDACMTSFLNSGVRAFIELLPGGALTGIAKRGMREVPSVAIKSPDDVASAVSLIESVTQ